MCALLAGSGYPDRSMAEEKKPPFRVSRVVHSDEADVASVLADLEADGYEDPHYLPQANGDLLIISKLSAAAAAPAPEDAA